MEAHFLIAFLPFVFTFVYFYFIYIQLCDFPFFHFQFCFFIIYVVRRRVPQMQIFANEAVSFYSHLRGPFITHRVNFSLQQEYMYVYRKFWAGFNALSDALLWNIVHIHNILVHCFSITCGTVLLSLFKYLFAPENKNLCNCFFIVLFKRRGF